jgi:hypothetical protein
VQCALRKILFRRVRILRRFHPASWHFGQNIQGQW